VLAMAARAQSALCLSNARFLSLTHHAADR
jgi:hypothetical protein